MTPAAEIVYGIIRNAVLNQDETPLMLDMKAELETAGIYMRRPAIAAIVGDLLRDGLVLMWLGKKGSDRQYGLPNDARRTVQRRFRIDREAEERRDPGKMWPRPTERSARSYDDAVARKLFAVDDMPPRNSNPVFVPRRYAPVRSECGCSAEMCAL